MQHWQRLAPHGPDMPMERASHAVVCLTSELDIDSTLLLLLGGTPNVDCWICNMQDMLWQRVSVACMGEGAS